MKVKKALACTLRLRRDPGPHEETAMEKAYDKFDWQQQRDKLRARWDRISDREFDDIGSERSRLVKRIQDAYGVTAAEAERQLAEYENAQSSWDPSSAEGPDPVPPTAVVEESEPGTTGMTGRTWQRPPEWERESDFNSEANAPRDPETERMQSGAGSKVHGDKLGHLTSAGEDRSTAQKPAANTTEPRKKK
jgi:hypothetical protein